MDKIYMQLDLLELLKLIECNITIKIMINFTYDTELFWQSRSKILYYCLLYREKTRSHPLNKYDH